MSATPRAYPLLARLRYAYFESGTELPVVENAWWERRWDGGRALGAVVEAMAHPRNPHRLRVHLRLRPDASPQEMEVTLLRPDGEGCATHVFLADAVRTEGEWNGSPFGKTTPMPTGYTAAPHCFAADGLHFRQGDSEVHRQSCFLLTPQSDDAPLLGREATFIVQPLGMESVDVRGEAVTARRYLTAYAGGNAPSAEFWISEGGYPLRMSSRRRTGEGMEILCKEFQTVFGEKIQPPGDGL